MSDWSKHPRIGPMMCARFQRRGWFRGGLCAWPPQTAMTLLETRNPWWKHPPMLCRRTRKLVRPIYYRPMGDPFDGDFIKMMEQAWRQCIR